MLRREFDESVSGVRNARGPGVRYERYAPSLPEYREEFFRLFDLVVLVVADEGCFDRIPCKELSRGPCILAGDDIRFLVAVESKSEWEIRNLLIRKLRRAGYVDVTGAQQ